MRHDLKAIASEAGWIVVVVLVLSYSWSFGPFALDGELEFAQRLAFLWPDLNEGALLHSVRTWFAIPLATLSFVIFRRILKVLVIDQPAIDLVSLTWILGSTAFPAVSIVGPHGLGSLGLLMALLGILSAEQEQIFGQARRLPLFGWGILSGVGMSLGSWAQPSLGILIVAVIVYVSSGALRNAPRFMLGMIVFALPGLLISLPLMGEFLTATPGEWQGKTLIFAIPGLLVVPYALVVLAHRSFFRLAALVAVSVIFVVWVGRFEDASAIGPLAAVPALTILYMGLAFAADASLNLALMQGVVKGGLISGLLLHPTIQAFVPKIRESLNPLVDLIPSMWDADIVAPNLGNTVFGLEGTWSLLPLAVIVLSLSVGLIARGSSWIKPMYRGGLVLVCVVVLGGYLAVTTQFGGTMPPEKQKKTMRSLDIWNEHQRSTDKEARKAARMIQEMGR